MFTNTMYENNSIVQNPTNAASTPAQLIELKGVSRSYQNGGAELYALREVELHLSSGQSLAIVGASGSGKSTLLNLLSGIDRATSGSLRVAGRDLRAMSEDDLAQFRGSHIGVVFQFFQLLPTLTSLENVLLAMDLVGSIAEDKRRPRALQLLERVGVSQQANKLPHTLSGGQQQRVAIARALANDPPLLVADEPTGNLDTVTKKQIFFLLHGLCKEGKSVVMATHETNHLAEFDQVLSLSDGRVVSESSKPTSTQPITGLEAAL